MNILIRNETLADRQEVEKITRQAFYNLYVPGCTEHYLVHVMRSHEDFVAELDFVIEVDNRVIGNVMYTKARLVDEGGKEKEVLTFGPISILPEYQRAGYGKRLLEYSFQRATELGYDVIVIFGSPSNYVSRGFQSCKKHRVCLEGGICPTAMMVKELVPGALAGKTWVYYDSPVMHIREEEAQRFDEGLENMEKKYLPSQEEFYILSNSVMQ